MLRTDVSDGIATIVIDQAGRGMNVVSIGLSTALDAEVTRLAADPSVTGIILTSAKDSFIAGADLAEVQALVAARPAAAEAAARLAILGQQIRRMERCGKPVVVALPGTALGGGLEVALGGHYRIAADNAKAQFGLPEVGLGLLPGAGGTQRLPRLLGLEKALSLLTTGKPVTPAQALDLGLVDEVVAPADLLPAALRALREGRVPTQQPWDIRGWQAPGLPINAIEAFTAFIFANAAVAAQAGAFQPAPGAILSCVYEGMRLPIDRALQIETQAFGRLLVSSQAEALIGARFFLRQRMGKRGLRRADPADSAQAAIAARIAAAIETEAGAIAATGSGANVVNNAALRAGLRAPLATPPSAGAAAATPAPDLDGIAFRLLSAGAAAVADVEDRDLADLAAIDLAGFPEWTGGPAHWRATRMAKGAA